MKISSFYRPGVLGIILSSILVLAWTSVEIGQQEKTDRLVEISEKDGMELVFVPEGEFIMGSDQGADDEKPLHKVYLDSFWIDKTEVTNSMYRLCVEDGECQHPQTLIFFDDHIFDVYPVVAVTWQDAVDYCYWAGRQLPTEAQWEKAARGTDGRIYPWGNNWEATFLNWEGSREKFRSIAPVGNYPEGASPSGVLDMVGNVWEWVADWYAGDYYSISPHENPLGPVNGFERVHRGGSWYDFEYNQRAANRDRNTPHFPDLGIGFRCVLVP